MFCQKCGKPSDAPICAACAAAEAQPVAQSVAPEVTQPVTQPVEAVQPAEVIELGDTNPQPPKKKSHKGVWISLVAVVAAVAVLAVAFWPTISRWFSSPEEYLQDVTKATLSSYTDTISSAYGTLLKGNGAAGDYNNTKVDLHLEMGDEVVNLLDAALKAQGISLDANALKDISLSSNIITDNNLLQVGLSAGLNAKQLLEIQAILDMENSIAYLGLPTLSSQHLALNLKELLGVDLSELSLMDLFSLQDTLTAEPEYDDDYFGDDYYGDDYFDDDYYGYDDDSTVTSNSMSSVLGLLMESIGTEEVTTLQTALPSEDDFNAMLDRYVEVALEQLTQVEESSETVTVGDHSQNQTVLTATIGEADVLRMAKAILQEAQNDATLKALVDAVDAYIQSTIGESVNLYSSLMAEIPGLISELDENIAQADATNAIVLKTYVDDDEALGYRITVVGNGETQEIFSYNGVKDGNTTYFQTAMPALTGSDAMVASGSYTEDGDNTKTVINIYAEGMTFTVEYETTATNTTLRLIPPAELMTQALADTPIPSAWISDGLALELSFSQPSDTQASVSLGIVKNTTSLITLRMNTTMGNATVTLPQDTVDPTDQTQLMMWAYDLVNQLPQMLTDAGLPEDLVQTLLSEVVSGLF